MSGSGVGDTGAYGPGPEYFELLCSCTRHPRQVVEGAGDVPAGDPPEGRAGSQKACLGSGFEGWVF